MPLTWNWVGARWWKFDFHSHTPASEDYGKGPDQALHKQLTPEEWLLTYMRAGIDCVAVTDHNSGAWIDRLVQSLVELNDRKPPDYRPLYLFPGVEITVQGNIHILAILPCTSTTSDIDSLLGAVKYRSTKGKSDSCSESSAIEVIKEIVRFKGIAIPAHVDKPSGLFTNFSGNSLEQILDCSEVIAMEVIDSLQAKPQSYLNKKLDWSEVLGTDSHHPSGTVGQAFPGSQFTWVKMSNPSLDGLRLALIDGNISLKRCEQVSTDANTHAQSAIECIEVKDAKYLGRGETFRYELNPWLNTIIGGRGAGKSTVLEFLRIGLQRRNEIPDSLKNDFEKYQQTSTNRHDEGLLTESAEFFIYFRKDGCRFRIAWLNAGSDYRIEEETSPNSWSSAHGDIPQRFPIRIYSQKQIFELAKQPQALLQIVDDAPGVNYRNWKNEWDAMQSKYFSLRAQEREVQTGLQEEMTIRGQLDDVIRKLKILEQSDHAEILQDYQLRQKQEKVINIWEQEWGNLGGSIRDLTNNIIPSEIDFSSYSSDSQEAVELADMVEQVRYAFQLIREEMQSIAERIDGIRNTWLGARPSLMITSKIYAAHQTYTDLMGQLSGASINDPSSYGELVKQRQSLEEKLESISKKKEMLSEYRRNASECLNSIREHRAKLTVLRNVFLESVLSGNHYVQISVTPYGDKESVEDEFRRLIDRSNGGFDRDIGSADSDEGILAPLYQATDETRQDQIDNVKSRIVAIRNNEDATISLMKDRRFASHIQGIEPEKLDRLDCWFPQDSLSVRYSLKNGDNFRPVEQGSPGQKTAALLAFILSYGDEPLILDQPEDDLDNQLIYDLIVTQLREIKQRRQVLVVTHNANIVVNGDAENVVVLDVRAGQTRIAQQGGLQDQAIRDEICRVMEGGKDAFNQRYRRINAGQ